MIVVFLSDCYNHHQSAFSKEMYRLLDGQYSFVATKPVGEERQKLGWKEEYPPFVMRWYESEAAARACEELIDTCDVLITGSAPEDLLKRRIRVGKMIIRYSERLYKRGYELYKWPVRVLRMARRLNHRNMYLLCSSAYAATDYALTGNFIGKTYKWGYFPEAKKLDLNELFSRRKINKKASILWVGRLIGWKHPESSILIAGQLMTAGYEFELKIIGNGEMESELRQMIEEHHLSDCVHLLGSMNPGQVREYMEQADIYLFTSDFNEGWGAVLNESMNSGCAVVASHAVGATPFLLQHEKNGLIFESGNIDDLYMKTRSLLDDPAKRQRLGMAAYETITQEWNGETAAERLLKLIDCLQRTGKCDLFASGPCSRARLLKNHWFKGETL